MFTGPYTARRNTVRYSELELESESDPARFAARRALTSVSLSLVSELEGDLLASFPLAPLSESLSLLEELESLFF